MLVSLTSAFLFMQSGVISTGPVGPARDDSGRLAVLARLEQSRQEPDQGPRPRGNLHDAALQAHDIVRDRDVAQKGAAQKHGREFMMKMTN